MLSVNDMRLINEGCDADFLSNLNESVVMNEALGKALIQSKKKQMSAEMKEAKKLISEGNRIRSKDPAEALKKYDAAIKIMENFKKTINEIEDDDIATIMIQTFVRTLIPFIPAILITVLNPVAGYISSFGSIVGAYIYGNKGLADVDKASNYRDYAKRFEMDLKDGKVKPMPWNKADGMKGWSRAEAMVACNKVIELAHKGRNNTKALIGSKD